MQSKLRSIGSAIAFVFLLSGVARLQGQTVDPLYFAASGSPTNYSWLSGGNWYHKRIDSNGIPIMVVCGCVPGPDDTAILQSVVDLPTSVKVHELDMVGSNTPGGAILNGGELTVDILLLQGAGTNDASIRDATVHVTAQMVAAGPFHNVLNGTTLIVQPGAALRLDATPSGGGSLILGAGTTLFNQGQVVMTDKSAIFSDSGGSPCVIQNIATLSSSGVATLGIINGDFKFDNNGTVRADTGKLTFAPGISWLSSKGTGKLQTAAATASLVVNSFAVASGVAIPVTGPGTTTFSNTFALNGTLDVGEIPQPGATLNPGHVLINGSVDGAGAIHVFADGTQQGSLTLTDNASGSAAEFSGPNMSITIDAGGLLNITGANMKVLSGTINNAGTAIWTGSSSIADIGFNDGCVFNNLAGALFDIRNDQFIRNQGGTVNTFNNAGTVRKSAGFASEIDADFNNSGLLDVQSGTLYFLNNVVQTAGSTNLDGGNIQAFALELNGGNLVGTGTFTGSIHNNGGTVGPGHSPGKITISRDYTQGANGILQIEVAGLTTPGVDFDQLAVAGVVTLGGTLQVTDINGFNPNSTDTVTAITASSVTGTFANTNTQVNYAPRVVTVAALAGSTPTPASQPLNISTRMQVLTDDEVLVAGFIITGQANTSKNVMIRGLGPSLVGAGVPNPLFDPLLELNGPSGFAPITNDNWQDASNASDIPNGFQPSDSRESVIIAQLLIGADGTGAYTAIVRGAHGETGVGLVEAYDLQAAAGQLANISTRGFIDTGANVMIGGFILGGGADASKVLIRALGPSLNGSGVSGALSDPTLEVHDSQGTKLGSNDNWKISDVTGQSQEAAITATTIPPSDELESAILDTFAPGAYTAIVAGKDARTGVALVEVYNLK